MSKEYSKQLDDLLNGQSLTEREAYRLMHKLAEGELPAALAGALLAGLRAKGETADEIRGFATAMRELAVHPVIPEGKPTVDTVGTGGDGSGSLNLSTGTGLLAAACGSRVVKHGNRSVSSRSGSADMLECLGMPLPLHEKEATACLQATNFTFLFAPAYHPAMKAVVPIRGALSVRTVFNVLGEPGWDEATPAGEFVLYDVRPDSVSEQVRAPADYGLAQCAPADLEGGDAEHNARELIRVFTGEDKGAHRDALLMGASLVLECQGDAKDPKDGVAQAAAAIDDGRAQAFLDTLRAHFEGQ